MEKLIYWFEIPASNFERAVKFYREVTLVEIKEFDFGKEKMACFPDDGINVSGAISYAPDFNPSSDGVLINFYGGNDLNDFLKRVEKAGGRVTTPKTKIEVEGRGYFAIFLDTEGNRLGVYSDN